MMLLDVDFAKRSGAYRSAGERAVLLRGPPPTVAVAALSGIVFRLRNLL